MTLWVPEKEHPSLAGSLAQFFQTRCQLKTHYLPRPKVSVFFFLSWQRLTPPIPWNFLKLFTGFCDCITLVLSSCLLCCSDFLSESSFCQSHLVFHYTRVFGNPIQSQDLNHHLCLDEFQISPSINFPLPPRLLSSLPICPPSLSLVQSSHLHLTFCLPLEQSSAALIHPAPGPPRALFYCGATRALVPSQWCQL